MADTSDGRPAELPAESEDGDPDSPERQGFFTRLFRRESFETSEDKAGVSEAAADGSHGARAMLVNLRNMGNMRVDDVSVPRPDIEAVSQDASLEEVLAVFQSSTNSRLPVFNETLDQPVGLVHLKDLALKYGFGAPPEGFDLRGLLRPLLYAPPSMPIGVLLQKMQAARIHMALVIDEYGGVDGLVTIEDLLEQIVGDIADEHDEDEGQLWTLEAPGVYIAQPRVDLDEFEAETGIRLADGDMAEETDTLGGLVYRLAGRVPARGEVVMHPDGHEFEVVDADARRITRMRVRLRAPGIAVEAAE